MIYDFQPFKNIGFTPLNVMSKTVTIEEFTNYMQPIVCNICRSIFNPTKTEKEELKQVVKDLDFNFEWEITLPKNKINKYIKE